MLQDTNFTGLSLSCLLFFATIQLERVERGSFTFAILEKHSTVRQQWGHEAQTLGSCCVARLSAWQTIAAVFVHSCKRWRAFCTTHRVFREVELHNVENTLTEQRTVSSRFPQCSMALVINKVLNKAKRISALRLKNLAIANSRCL